MSPPLFKAVGSFFFAIFTFYVLWLVIRVCAFDYFTIASSSMYPTLQVKDKVVVNKLLMGPRIYKSLNFVNGGQELKSWRFKGFRDVTWNDIVIFNFPVHDDKISFVINDVFCKRVIGLPGDTISIVNSIYRNNNYNLSLGRKDCQLQLQTTPDSLVCMWTYPGYEYVNWTIKNFGPLYIPRKGDEIQITPLEFSLYRQILEWEIGAYGYVKESAFVTFNGKPITRHTFKHNYYFMVGDNVTNSNDSRYWGLVPEEYIVGIVYKIITESKD